jgi:hypothetical protein
MYSGVPSVTPDWVPPRCPSWAMPKSMSFATRAPSGITRKSTLSGLRSRCTMAPGDRTRWAASTAAHT